MRLRPFVFQNLSNICGTASHPAVGDEGVRFRRSAGAQPMALESHVPALVIGQMWRRVFQDWRCRLVCITTEATEGGLNGVRRRQQRHVKAVNPTSNRCQRNDNSHQVLTWQPGKCLHDLRIKLLAALAHDFSHRLGYWPSLFVGALVRQGVENIGHG